MVVFRRLDSWFLYQDLNWGNVEVAEILATLLLPRLVELRPRSFISGANLQFRRFFVLGGEVALSTSPPRVSHWLRRYSQLTGLANSSSAAVPNSVLAMCSAASFPEYAHQHCCEPSQMDTS